MAQKASTRMPPTIANDFEPPDATRMIPMAVMRTVGMSAANMNVRRARLRKIAVGDRCFTLPLLCQRWAPGARPSGERAGQNGRGRLAQVPHDADAREPA